MCRTQKSVGTPPMAERAARVIVIISLHYTVKQSCWSCVLSPNRGAGRRSRYLRRLLLGEPARRPCVGGVYSSLETILTIWCRYVSASAAVSFKNSMVELSNEESDVLVPEMVPVT